MRNARLLPVLLLGTACASSPEMDRPVVARPEVQRAETVEPEGLTAMRDAIDAQRAEARARDNALNMTPTTLGAEPLIPWYETWLWELADLFRFVRNF